MKIPFFQVDAFTNKAFQGNPAGVCILNQKMPDSWMQSIAFEMNFSETAFISFASNKKLDIRFFTPTTEVPLCGHATLSSAYVLWEENFIQKNCPIRFYSKSGKLDAELVDGWIALQFPVDLFREVSIPPIISELIGTEPIKMYRTVFCDYYLIELFSEKSVQSLSPNFEGLVKEGFNEVITTAKCNTGLIDFVLRFFAPGVGINEDPVTGSAFCSLGPYWAKRLNKNELIGKQISKRGGTVKVQIKDETSVTLLGKAISVMRGELLI